jgi:hypothetical protein
MIVGFHSGSALRSTHQREPSARSPKATRRRQLRELPGIIEGMQRQCPDEVLRGGVAGMPLPGGLLHIDLTFNCPHCNRALVKSGGWFQSVSQFRCEGCQRILWLTYDDKVVLFEKHAHLAQRPTD